MLSTSIRVASATVLLVCVLGVAHAQPPGGGQLPQAEGPERWADHPFGAEIDFGVDNPTGLIGAVFDWTPLWWLSLEGGLGLDRTDLTDSTRNVQSSLMARGRAVYGGWGASVGVGTSIGSFKHCNGCPFESGDVWSWDHAVWLNAEVAIEHRWRSGLGVRIFAGLGQMLNSGTASCAPHVKGFGCDQVPPDVAVAPYLGVGFHIPLMTSSR